MKLNLASTACLLLISCSAVFGQEVKKVQEPEYLGIFFLLDSSTGNLVPLERQTPETKAKAAGHFGLPVYPSRTHQDVAAGLRAALAARKGTTLVVKCANGDILGFSNEGVDSLIERNVKLKRRLLLVRLRGGPSATTPTEWAELAELFELALTYGEEGGLTAASLKVQISRLKEPESCDVQELLAPARTDVQFETPTKLRQVGIGGNVNGWAIYDYVKPKPKDRPETCTIVYTQPSLMPAFPPDLAMGFRAEVETRVKKRFARVLSPDTVPAPDTTGYELRIFLLAMVELPYPNYVGDRNFTVDAGLVAFTVTDRASGRIVFQARGARLTGTKREKDLRDLAAYVTCG